MRRVFAETDKKAGKDHTLKELEGKYIQPEIQKEVIHACSTGQLEHHESCTEVHHSLVLLGNMRNNKQNEMCNQETKS
ncbi:conserved hypothetical protein [Ricinus communis]|uniref:Uncharacterized protein n=1 Tax=Ricinus communis TaxID=3988 RepID=B9SSY5_RICCO|nr:conserved hypothetical protein [Ricinus communis]